MGFRCESVSLPLYSLSDELSPQRALSSSTPHPPLFLCTKTYVILRISPVTRGEIHVHKGSCNPKSHREKAEENADLVQSTSFAWVADEE